MTFGSPGIYAYPSIASGVFLFLIAVWTFQNRDERGATEFAGMMLTMSGWCIFNGMNLLAQTHSLKIFFFHATLVCVFATPVVWVLFSLKFTDNMDLWTNKIRVPILGGAVFFILVSATNQLHFAFMSPRPLTTEPFLMLEGQSLTLEQPLYILAYLYAYVTVLGANYLLIRLGMSSGNLHKNQIILLLAGLFIAMALGVFTAIGWSPHGIIDLVPYGIGIWGIILAYVYHQHHLFDVAPVARERIVSNIRDPMITIDHKGRVTDWNRASESLFIRPPDGDHLSQVAPEELLAALAKVGVSIDDYGEKLTGDGAGDVDEQVNNVPLVVNGEQRVFNIRLNIINEGRPRCESKVILMRDITKIVEQRKKIKEQNVELKRQNERLDDFAGVLAHDLRNPLASAKGYLDLSEETYKEDHFAKVKKAHDRMEDMIDDLLVLARQGKEVTETEEIALDEAVREAWDVVDTFDGTLHVDTELTISADQSRISNLLENLIRNSFEHVGEETTIYVGEIGDGDGFYFADDGPGIPEKHRDNIFDYGYTTNSDGTGFGLNIVKEIVEAHDWSLSLDDSDEYGAKFDIQFES